MKYVVYVREVWVQAVYVEADNPQQAIEAVKNNEFDCEYDEEDLEFSHRMDTDFWTAEEANEDD